MKTTLQRLWLLTIMTFATIGANAYQFEVDGIRYDVTSSVSPYTVEVVSRQGGYAGEITIPTKVRYYNTSTHGYCYYEVTSIGEDAFLDCTGLTSISIPNSVTEIGDYAFAGCSGLTAVTIPQSVDSIGGGAFKQCPALTSITCERETPCVLSSTESDYTRNINLYVSWDAVPNYNNAEVWRNFKNIYSSNTIGGYGVGYRRYSQYYLVIVSGGGYENHLDIQDTYNYNGSEYYVRKIGEKAFYGNNSFKSLFLHRSIKEIGDKAFYGCDSLKSVTVESLRPWEITHTSTSFSNMSDITLYVPYGCKADYEVASFWNQFGAMVEGAENPVFTVDGINYRLTSDTEVAVIGGDLNYWTGYGRPAPTTVNYRNATFNVTSVADYAFDGRQNLNSPRQIYLPTSIKSIGNYAFRNTNL